MKKQGKKIIFSTALLSLAVIPVAGSSLINSVNTAPISKVETETHAVTNPTTTLEIYLNKDYKTLSWYNKEFSKSVTEENLKELLVPSKQFDVNWGINILTPTDGSDALSSGYVEFAVYQIQKNIKDGVSAGPTQDNEDVRSWIDAPTNIKYNNNTNSNISMKSDATGNKTINGVSIPAAKVWTTKNIAGLFLPYKYKFSWNTNDQIGEFLSKTSEAALTPDSVYSNMISTSSITDILPSETEVKNLIKFDQANLESTYGISNANATKYGVGLVTIDFITSTTVNNGTLWSDGTVPKVTRLVRGLGSTKEVMHLNTYDDGGSGFLATQLNLEEIVNKNPNFKAPAVLAEDAKTASISDFTPSELINALTFSSSGSNINNLLATQDFLVDKNQAPALFLTYMGSNMFNAGVTGTDTAKQWKGTGLQQQGAVDFIENGKVLGQKNAADISNIVSITPTADDVNGTLNLKVTYNYFDVYRNVVEANVTESVSIQGMQKSDVADDLFAQWKNVESLLFSNVTDAVDAFTKNKANKDYLKSFSNSFFLGSQTTYDLDREVNVTANGNNLTIDLTFPQFGRKKDFKVSNTFTLKAGTSGINFNSQEQVQNSIKDYATYSPSNLIDAILSGKVSLSNFVSVPSGATAVVTQSDTNDGIIIEVTLNNGSVSSAFYNGLQKSPSVSYVYNFAFSDDTDKVLQEGLGKLRSIPIEKISNENVFEYYISKLPVYNGSNKINLSTTDIKNISKNLESNSIDVSILVPLYNSANTGVSDEDRTFSITLKGFISEKQLDQNSNAAKADLTIPLSATFAAIIVLIMVGVLIHIIVRQKRLSKSKVNLKELRSSTKKTK